MFKPALTDFIGSTGNGLLHLAIQFILFALIVVGAMRLIAQLLQKRTPKQAALVEQESAAIVDGVTLDSAAADDTTGDDTTNIGSLMLALRNQAVEIRSKHATLVSGLSLDFELLSDRLATIGSQVSSAVESARKSEISVAQLSVENDDYKKKLADAEHELDFVRPEMIRLEDELRTARKEFAERERRVIALGAENASAQRNHGELLDKLTSSEAARQRAIEERAATGQKLNERDFSIQSLMLENAGLKSELASVASNLEMVEREAKFVAEKYAAEQRAGSKASEAAMSLQLQLEQLRKDNIVQADQFEGRKAVIAETLTIKKKQLNDSENKRVALEAGVEFFSRMNQRLREEARRNLEHISSLEGTNRKLLDSLSRYSTADRPDNIETIQSAPVPRAVPRLIAPPETSSVG
jgi:chromosome segregation ATPase